MPGSATDAATTFADRARPLLSLGPVLPLWWLVDGVCSCPKGADCASPGKHPSIGNGGVYCGTRNGATIEAWGRTMFDANVAVVTGGVLLVVDVDGPKGAAELAALEKEHSPLPLTVAVRTGREGGRHFYFRIPDDVELGCCKLAPHIDTRGKGGYVVGVGSTHASGRIYEYEVSPDECDVAEAPAWLVEILARKHSSGARDDEAASIEPAVSSRVAELIESDDQLGALWRGEGKTTGDLSASGYDASVAAELRRHGVPEDEIAAAIAVRPGAHRSDARYAQRTARRIARYVDESIGESLPSDVDPFSELGNAHRLVRDHGGDLRHTAAFGWLAWDGQRWAQAARDEAERRMQRVARGLRAQSLELHSRADQEKDEDRAKSLRDAGDRLFTFARKSQSRPKIANAISLAEVHPRIAVQADVFDVDPWLFNTNNGTTDLRTGELRPHRRDDLLTKLSPVDYDPSASAPVFAAFLNRIFDGDADLIGFVQRFAGYSLSGATSAQCFVLLYGGGANGKSTLLELLAYVLGDYASNTSADVLMQASGRGPDNDVARLRGARFVTASESGEGRRLDEERVKRLTGGDRITARFLYREHFEFVPAFKLWLATNSRPEIRGTDYAIWRRVRLVPFNVTIPPAEQDPQLPAKLRSEASGVLSWAVEGCLEWQRNGLRPPSAVTAATDDYRADQNVVGRFIAECCTALPQASVKTNVLYAAFSRWCRDSGEDALSSKAFGSRLKTDGRFTPGRGNRGRFWRGIGLDHDALTEGRDA